MHPPSPLCLSFHRLRRVKRRLFRHLPPLGRPFRGIFCTVFGAKTLHFMRFLASFACFWAGFSCRLCATSDPWTSPFPPLRLQPCTQGLHLPHPGAVLLFGQCWPEISPHPLPEARERGN